MIIIALVLMILSAVVFFVDTVGWSLGDVHAVSLGLLLMAAALAISLYYWPRRPL